MSVFGVFSKGRPTGHPAATGVLRYIPRPRVPWQPSRFSRANLEESDLARLWGKGRYRTGPGNFNSGYSTAKTHVLEDHTIDLIPKHELEKYMPDISLGSKALVTPVSLMSARNGHRVTHDMIHSYDPHIGRLGKPAVVDHAAITPEDPNRVGLNAATLDCRGRIYRWLRRGPFFQEDHYFRRSTKMNRDGTLPEPVHEMPLIAKVVRLARRGRLKVASEEYRRITGVPPVEVYRALTAACVPGAKLADAVAIFEDGNARLFYAARDGEVLFNLMRCAIRARHRVRVMWVYNTMRGRYYENTVVRAEIDPIWRYRIAAAALDYLLDSNADMEARAVYDYLAGGDSGEAGDSLLNCDVHIRLGQMMQVALKEGKAVAMKPEILGQVALVRNAEAAAPQAAALLYKRYQAGLAGGGATWAQRATLPQPPAITTATAPAEAVAWLQTNFPDIDPMAVLRLARFRHGQRDLLAKDPAAFLERAARWVEQLSSAHHAREEVPLPYLRKSRPSMTNAKVRVAWLPERRRPTSLLANEEGYRFFYRPATRFVEETFAFAGESLRSQLLAQRPLHREVTAAEPLDTDGLSQCPPLPAPASIELANTPAQPLRQLHESVFKASAEGRDQPFGRGRARGAGSGGQENASDTLLHKDSRRRPNAAATTGSMLDEGGLF